MPALKILRYDDNCALCRVAKADKTGSHLAPNFLVHGAFSFDGKGGRFREIVTRDNLNTQSRWLFYGQEVSPEAISADRGRSLTDEELEGNINVLAYGCGAYVDFPGRGGQICDEGDFGQAHHLGPGELRKGRRFCHADGRCLHAGEVLEGEEGIFQDSEGY